LTPALATAGAKLSKRLEEKSDFTHYLGQDRDANEIKESDDFAVVVGYGAVGKVICDLMDRKLIKYVGIDNDPNKAIQARNAGLPVFYGDIGRQEVCEAFNVGKAKAVIVCIADQGQATRAVIALRRFFPKLKIFARAANADHAYRLQTTLDVAAMVPVLPVDNLLMTLPFAGAVLKALGSPPEEVNAILETKRKEVLSGRGQQEDEEESALFQLGIDPSALWKEKGKEKPQKKPDSDRKEPASEDEDYYDEFVSAAAGRLEEAKARSPFVAQVIGEVCPESLEEAERDEIEAEVPNEFDKNSTDIIDAQLVPAIGEDGEE
jgi:voltage-gated potassium channel Kch